MFRTFAQYFFLKGSFLPEELGGIFFEILEGRGGLLIKKK